jgi:hypothetical protein
LIESVEAESVVIVESVAIVESVVIAGVSTDVTVVVSAASSAGLLVQAAKVTIPATNANANIFFISLV